jgi:hypothetical protein
VKASRDMADFACHPAAILSDGSYTVFAKFSDAANGREQFENVPPLLHGDAQQNNFVSTAMGAVVIDPRF